VGAAATLKRGGATRVRKGRLPQRRCRREGDGVLVLVTAVLVLVGLVLLAVGFAHSALSLIYASIGCTAVAGVVLIYLGRANRREAVRLANDEAGLASRAGSRPAPDGVVEDASPAPDRTGTAGVDDRPVPGQAQPPGDLPSTAAPHASRAGAHPDAPTAVAGDGAAFPINNYDELRVGEILPRLRGLEPDELEEVRLRESTGKSRSVILRRVVELLASQATNEPPHV
jgi:hypothetical protein